MQAPASRSTKAVIAPAGRESVAARLGDRQAVRVDRLDVAGADQQDALRPVEPAGAADDGDADRPVLELPHHAPELDRPLARERRGALDARVDRVDVRLRAGLPADRLVLA